MLIYPIKKSGETMGNFVSRVKAEYSLSKLAYTARLDPMAKGIVPFLVSEDCANIKKFLHSEKTYQVKIIFAIQTDTDDPLGIIFKSQELNKDLDIHPITKSIHDYLESIKNTTFEQKYHHYSTKMMNHRRKGINKEASHKVSVYNYKIISESDYPFDTFKSKVIRKIDLIDKSNNFRQDVISKQWIELELETVHYIKLEIKVSSGFFIRQLIRDMSNTINFPFMCYNIHRTNIDN